MGCDIHLFAEKKVNNKWITIEKWEKDEDYKEELCIPHEKNFYTDGRNYNLFCALAGVRKSHFENDPPQVSPEKGVPSDCCEEIQNKIEAWRSDGHTHSWLTLEELENFDWSEYGDTCDEFLQEVLPKMKAENTEPQDVRIVFFFYN